MNTEKRLYQWDTGQKLVGCTGLYVDFPIGTEVYRVETTDGMCIIPDELLQTSGGHKVYECMTNNTIRSFAFSVTPRPKPPDYVYTPTERLTFEGLVQKVDDAVADMIRRADSGEFDGHTPVKGTDYFTTEEIQQIQNEVSSGAIGEFKSVVDTETNKFNANAIEKLTEFNANATKKLTEYNGNAEAKLNAYNANANNKVAEFDSHTEQIQMDISELKSDLSDIKNTTDNPVSAGKVWMSEDNGGGWHDLRGGDSGYRLIADITISDDANRIEITADSDGAPFSLKTARIFVIHPIPVNASPSNGYVTMKDANGSIVYYGVINWKVPEHQSIAAADFTVYGDDAPATLVCYHATKIEVAASSTVNMSFGSKLMYFDKIEKVTLHANGVFESGTKIIVIGKDVQ